MICMEKKEFLPPFDYFPRMEFFTLAYYPIARRFILLCYSFSFYPPSRGFWLV